MMMHFGFLPEWLCFVLTLGFVLISLELGYRVGNARRIRPDKNPESAAGSMSGTALGLLAFMLAFTFNGASADHDSRKNAALEEAGAIRTAYERSMVLPDPSRVKIHGLLRDYVDLRLSTRKSRGMDLKHMVDKNITIQTGLWTVSSEIQRKDPNSATASLFAQSLNEIFRVHIKRVEAIFENRISIYIWIVLYFLTFFSMAMMGYRIGLEGTRSVFIEVSLALTFSLVLILIIALDRPLGMMQVSQGALIDVQRMLYSAG